MKIYLAARYSLKNEIREKAQDLINLGIEVTSSWLQEPHNPNIQLTEVSDELNSFYARQDIEDIRRAEWLVLFSQSPTLPGVRGGRHVEFGYALGLGKKLMVVGPKENIFHHLPNVIQVDTWEKAVSILSY
jgi:hypothetical protein